MITLKGYEAMAFKKMFSYIPGKIFPSVVVKVTEDCHEKTISIVDIDINSSLIFNSSVNLSELRQELERRKQTETEMKNKAKKSKSDESESVVIVQAYSSNDDDTIIEIALEETKVSDEKELPADYYEEFEFRMPLTKSVRNVLKKFNEFTISNNSIMGIDGDKSITLSMMEYNDRHRVYIPGSMQALVDNIAKGSGGHVPAIVEFTLTKEKISELLSYIDMLDIKADDVFLKCKVDPNTRDIVINSSDTPGNRMIQVIKNVEYKECAPEYIACTYDKYLIAILKTLKNSSLPEFKCQLSSFFFGVELSDDINAWMAATVYSVVK